MRNEDSIVDVHTHALRAEDRTRANGRLHRALDAPQVKWWHRFFKWEPNLTVANKVIEKGFVITPQIAGILLVAFLSVLGWAYKSNTADQRETRDAIIEMKTMLNERTQTFKEQQAEIKSQMDTERRVAEIQREKQRDELRDMKVALQLKGIRVKESQ
jgi:hypothetical protein